MNALSMLEHLVEPDHRRVVELYPLCHSYTIFVLKRNIATYSCNYMTLGSSN